MNTSRQRLLAEIEGFLAKQSVSATWFGRMCLADGTFVRRLRGGASCSLETADRIREFMRTYRPTRPATDTKSRARVAA